MHLIVRAFILTSLAWIAGQAHPALAGPAVRVSEEGVNVAIWACGERDEILRQSVPVPQLLFVRDGVHGEVWAAASSQDTMHGFLSETRSLSDRLAANYRHEWFQEKAARLSTNALVLPSALWHVANEEQLGAVFLIWLSDGQGEVPALHLRPPHQSLEVSRFQRLVWTRDGHAPVDVHFRVFPAELLQERNSFPGSVVAYRWDAPDASHLLTLRKKFMSGSVFWWRDDHCL